jgi:hypothetical protein
VASPRGAVVRSSTLAAIVAVALLLSAVAPGVRASSYPALPVALGRQFLSNLTLPSVAPGGSTELGFTVADPKAMNATLTAVVVTFQVYAFNGFPGNATALLPVANAPVLVNSTSSGAAVNVSVPTLLAGGAVYRGSVGLVTSAATPSGTFAVRTAISFVANATDYRLESRGWFPASLWAQATTAPNGTPTLNLTVLHVSGVVPETAVLVVASDWEWALAAILAASLLCVGVGAWLYFRRGSGPGSSSGAG